MSLRDKHQPGGQSQEVLGGWRQSLKVPLLMVPPPSPPGYKGQPPGCPVSMAPPRGLWEHPHLRYLHLQVASYPWKARRGFERQHGGSGGEGQGRAGPGLCWRRGAWERSAGNAVCRTLTCLSNVLPQSPQESPLEHALSVLTSCCGWEHFLNSSWGTVIGAGYWTPGKPVPLPGSDSRSGQGSP